MVTDAFIKLQQAEVLDSMDHHSKELCVTFGGKIPYEFVKVVPGVGNSANAAVAAARLGLHTALISDVGGDTNGKEMIESLTHNNVITDYVTVHNGMESNYHYVLWYDTERTILVKHHEYPYSLPYLSIAPKFIYLSSLAEHSLKYHEEIIKYLKAHPAVKLAFQPGTFQIKLGTEALKDVYARTDVFFSNKEEAIRILKNEEQDIKILLKKIADLGPKIVVITDGVNGAYMYDRKDTWFIPMYPHEAYERTGAGDAFASTFVSALILGKSLEEAILWAPINAMGATLKIGAQEGLLTEEKIIEYLRNSPKEYLPKKI
jgi:ribokinase